MKVKATQISRQGYYKLTAHNEDMDKMSIIITDAEVYDMLNDEDFCEEKGEDFEELHQFWYNEIETAHKMGNL